MKFKNYLNEGLGSAKGDYATTHKRTMKVLKKHGFIQLWKCPKCDRKNAFKYKECPRCKTKQPKNPEIYQPKE